MTKKLAVLDLEVLSPSPVRKTPTPLDVYWRCGEDGPVALCGPCARRLGLPLLDTNGKEPCTGEKCAECGPKDEKEKGE